MSVSDSESDAAFARKMRALDDEILRKALEMVEKDYRRQGKSLTNQPRSGPWCRACGDLRPDAFNDPFEGMCERRTEFRYITDAAVAGCGSCSVLAAVIADLADAPWEGRSARLVMSAEPTPRSALRYQYHVGGSLEPHCIDLYAMPDARTKWDAIGWECRRNVSDDSGSSECMGLVHRWLQLCDELHPNCRQAASELPARVIYVGGSEPRLYISNGETADSVALSHRWGEHRPMTTEKATLADRTRCIPHGHPPRLFQDAVALTRALGVDHLWIDSLCIVQDDKEDWEAHAPRMGHIYANAYLTISADDAADSRQPILGPRDHRARRHIAVPCPGLNDGRAVSVYARTRVDVRADYDSDRHYVVRSIPHCRDEVPRSLSLLDTRGWTFQERLLAPRTLHYTAQELVFECREDIWCECSPVRDTDRCPRRELFKNQAGGFGGNGTGPGASFNWSSVVENFTARRLTVGTDRLFALAGVAVALSPYSPDDYLAGLWRPELKWNLLWEVPYDVVDCRRNGSDYAPTWSWASVTGEVRCRLDGLDEISEDTCDWAEVVKTEVYRAPDNPYGPGSGAITLRGLVGPATITRLKMPGKGPSIKLPTWLGQVEDGIFKPDDKEVPEVRVGERVTVLVNLRVEKGETFWRRHVKLNCTVLKAVEGSTGTFRRVGKALFFIRRVKLMLLRSMKVAEVRII